jgi:3D-(3,5/4)-trihydroxycyclohexane-1,2-dione acylhydrolase (decyclizing)
MNAQPASAPQRKVRLTMAQALVRYLAPQLTRDAAGNETGLFAGVFAIFGHGNVAALGEALYAERDRLPTYRAHNEQAMAHTAIAFAKSTMRRQMMACTTSIGPGATNLVTAAALAHVNRLPVLLLPGDIFVSRAPDPVLQQVESFTDGTVSANDCLRPVSRYFDRIVHPQQLLTALPRAVSVLTDAALCGPVTLALPQDVQAAAFDYPESFFAPRVVMPRAPSPSPHDIANATALLRNAKKPLIVAGGGVLYSEGGADALRAFAEAHGVAVAETQAGKGALAFDHPLQAGAIGVTGATSANALARDADLVIAIGTRLSDFTTGSHALFGAAPMVSINVQAFDALKADATAMVIGDAAQTLAALTAALAGWRADPAWTVQARDANARWHAEVDAIVAQNVVPSGALPYEGDVIGAVQRSDPQSVANDVVVCAAGTLPAELHKLWRTSQPGGYHVEYGYSCMGYEIAGGLGVKMALPDREVVVMLGDGSYLMMNSEIATSVAMQRKLVIVVLDNRGYACINRLQQACGGAPFNNLLDERAPAVDFAAHARALGADAVHVASIDELQSAMQRARRSSRTQVIVIDTDPVRTTDIGGAWWEVAVPEVSARAAVRAARAQFDADKALQRS